MAAALEGSSANGRFRAGKGRVPFLRNGVGIPAIGRWCRFGLVLGLVLVGLWSGEARAQVLNRVRTPIPPSLTGQPPLTQADIDSYVYLTPRLAGPAGQNPDKAVEIFRRSGFTRSRAVFVGAKVAVTQALASGLMSQTELEEQKVPLPLRPSAEELQLVTRNLDSLVQAQDQARQAAAQDLP
jgi:hypothetical protein